MKDVCDVMKRAMHGRQRRFHVTGLAVTLLGLSALLSVAGCDKGAAPSGAASQAAPVPEVATVTLTARPVRLTTSLPGRTTAFRVAEIRPQVNGIILKRLFEEGSDVKEGQQLYQIDPATYQAALDSATATQARAEALLKSTTLTVERYKKLEIGRDISTQDYDNAVAAQLQAQADVLAAKAAIQTARINLDYTKVYSPITGRIGRSAVTEGALVTANQATALATVQQLDPIYVDVTQSTVQLQSLKRRLADGRLQHDTESQKQVKLLLDNDEVYGEKGTLQFRDVTVEASTGTVILRIVFANPNQMLLPGMFVRAEVEEGIQPSAILIPQQSVSRDVKGNPTVLMVNSAGKVELRTIVVDRPIDDQWLVVSGVAPGDRVIAEGMQKVRPGATVKEVPFAGGAKK